MQKKIKLSLIIFFSLFAAVIIKAFYIQVINRNKLIAYSDSQYLRTGKIYPKRGNIVDRNMNPLALNLYNYKVAIDPTKVSNKSNAAKGINRILRTISYQQALLKLKKAGRYSLLADEIKLSEQQIASLKQIPGMVIESHSTRFYPNHELASQLLGFVGKDNEGLSGVEYAFDKELKGEPIIYRYYRDAKGRPVKLSSQELEKTNKDIVLTIDKDLQGAMEEYLKEVVEFHQADRAGAAVMNAETGEIYAMGNYPYFDPNSYKRYPLKHTNLGFISDALEPGSSFKTFTIAAGLEAKLMEPHTKFYCEGGKLKVGKHIIHEAETDKKFEWLTATDILKYSSNVGTTKIAFKLGQEPVKKIIQDLHLAEKTGIELKGEGKGIYKGTGNFSKIKLSNVSFGQGIALTPIQLLRAYGIIANGGNDIKPTILLKENQKRLPSKRILSQVTTDKLTRMLVKAVEDGTGLNARMSHFEIAGKTSTAQKVSANGGYQGYVSGFVGYPVNMKEKFVIYVYVDHPTKHGYYGNLVAAPVFKKIASYLIFKDKQVNKMAQFKNDSKVIDQISVRNASHRISSIGTAPNFIGLDKISAEKLAKKLKLKVEMKGFGLCRKQYPASGSLVSGQMITLDFSPPQYE